MVVRAPVLAIAFALSVEIVTDDSNLLRSLATPVTTTWFKPKTSEPSTKSFWLSLPFATSASDVAVV